MPGRLLPAGTGLLQRKCGCHAASSGLASAALPGSGLRVNQRGDQYEQEADRVAEQVMRMSDPAIVQKQVRASAADYTATPMRAL